MRQPTIRLPRPLYYVLITTITELILVSGAVLILLPTGFLEQLPLRVLGFLLIYKTIIATVVLIIMDRKRWQEHAVIVKGGGLLLGHVVGLLLGGILGGQYGGVFWAIVGVISLYFIVGRIGAKISSAIGIQLDRIFSFTEETESASTIRLARPTRLLMIIYGLVAPALFVLIAIFLSSSGIPSSRYSEELPIARIAVIGVSLFSIFLPWLLQTRWLTKSTISIVSRENATFILGMGLSIAPVVYGFILFIAFGASMIELGLFAVASSLAAILWSANTRSKQQNAG
jgi:hypothetical protein